MIEKFIFLVQLVVLCGCLYMLWRARQALNGLGRSMILLIVLLIVRRLDDALQVLDGMGVLILSSAVVLVVAYDVFQIYRAREVYALYLQNRKRRIAELEKMIERKAM